MPEESRVGARFVLRLWLLVAVFAAVTIARSVAVDIPLRDPHGGILLLRGGISLGLFAALVALDGAIRSGRPRSRRRIMAAVRQRWDRRRLGLALGGLLAYHLVYFCYHNLKSWDVFRAPRDAMLLHWDRVLFLGHSPAVLLHDLLGQHVAAYVLLAFYESFSTLATVAVVAAAVFPERIRDTYVALTAGAWIWILGVASYYAIPSLGPFWSERSAFAGLPHTLIQDTQSTYLAQRDHLLAHPHAPDAFAQISAFASLHVGVTTVILLVSAYFGLRRTTRVLAVFLAVTMVATIYLGWHFVVDDIAGVGIALLAMWLAKRQVGRGSERAPTRLLRPTTGRRAG